MPTTDDPTFFRHDVRLFAVRHRKLGRKPSFSFGPDSIITKAYQQLTPSDREFYRALGSLFAQGGFWVCSRLYLELYLYCIAATNYAHGHLTKAEYDAAWPPEIRQEMGTPIIFEKQEEL